MAQKLINVRISGLSELDDALKSLPKNVERKVIRGDLAEAGELMRGAMAVEAPKDSGFLSEHFGVRVKVASNEISGTAIVGPLLDADYPDRDGTYRQKFSRKLKRYVDVGRVSVSAVARWMETGTVKMAPNPFITRAYEMMKEVLQTKIINGIREALFRG